MPAGILNIDKPGGPTSHDVVDRIRTLIGVRRVGHAGTLDPMATGVLLICVGRATRVSEYLMSGRKTYRAELLLGVTTDTYDAQGEIVARKRVDVDRTEVESALDAFRGSITQRPPMYSALKRDGVPLYKLARRGVEVEREPRAVEIFRLELLDWRPPCLELEVACSSGTYVRSLAHDLGRALGCGAHLTTLTRRASGGFRVEEGVSLETFAEAAQSSTWEAYLHPIDAALRDFPALTLDAEEAWRLCNGQAVDTPAGPSIDLEASTLARVYDPQGEFLALASYDGATGRWQPHKVFRPHYPRPGQREVD